MVFVSSLGGFRNDLPLFDLFEIRRLRERMRKRLGKRSNSEPRSPSTLRVGLLIAFGAVVFMAVEWNQEFGSEKGPDGSSVDNSHSSSPYDDKKRRV